MIGHRTPAAVLGAALLLLGACTGDDPEPRSAPTTTSPPTTAATTTTEPSDEDQLRQLAEDWFEANRQVFAGEIDGSTLDDYLSDPYLGQVEAQLEDYNSRGLVVAPTDRSSAFVESVTFAGQSATVVECLVNGDRLIEVASGEVIDDAVNAYRTSTEATRTQSGWRFSERVEEQRFEGSAECAS